MAKSLATQLGASFGGATGVAAKEGGGRLGGGRKSIAEVDKGRGDEA